MSIYCFGLINMEQQIPRIYFKKDQTIGIEVVNFEQLLDKLNQSMDHAPFSVHKIEFYLILIVIQQSYTHFVDFKSYQLTKGAQYHPECIMQLLRVKVMLDKGP